MGREKILERARKRRTKKVNSLVRKAFGLGFRGNWAEPEETGSAYGGFITLHHKREVPDIIARRIPVIPIFISIFQRGGRFTSFDGSRLEVPEGYEAQAEKYQRLYFREFKEVAQINILTAEEARNRGY